jgi:hypothetical protein
LIAFDTTGYGNRPTPITQRAQLRPGQPFGPRDGAVEPGVVRDVGNHQSENEQEANDHEPEEEPPRFHRLPVGSGRKLS